MSTKATILRIKNKSIAELRMLLSSKELVDFSSKEKLDFFRQIDQESKKPLFLALVVKSIEHLNLLLNHEVLIKNGHDFCSKLVQITDNNKMGILELASRKPSASYLKEILDSKIFQEILSPKELHAVFIQANRFEDNNFNLLMDQSIEHYKVLLDSQVLVKLKESDLFQLLNSTNENNKLNSFWKAILKGEEYWHPLLNSSILNKLDTKETSALLSGQYTEDNSDIPLGYIINHFSNDGLQKFLSSKAFKKLDAEEEYKQYMIQNDNGKTVLDIAMNKSLDAFRLLLECPRCLDILTNEQKVSILTTTHTKMGLPIIYKTLTLSNDYENLILNSEVIVNMPQSEKTTLLKTALYSNLNVVGSGIDETAPDSEIIDDPEKFAILKNSAVFKSLDLDIQQKLLGQHTEDLEVNSTSYE